LGGVYKLVEIGDRPVAKFSASKVTYPGGHQVYRSEKDGVYAFDHLGLVKEPSYEFVSTTPLLVPVVQSGKRVWHEDITAARARCREQVQKLPAPLRQIGAREDKYEKIYEVRPSARLQALLDQLKHDVQERA
jgi:nicotinate phosphoribosyltransferase